MGIFTDKCRNPECNMRVRKGSRFCPHCGGNAPRGLAMCGACKAEVSTASKFCWRCGADLAIMSKPILIEDRWSRRPEDFAVRVDDQDIQGWLTKPLIVEHGTRALLFQNGEFKGELGEGRYDMGGFLSKLRNFLVHEPASAIICDAGDVIIDVENGDLWTEDGQEVGTAERLVFRARDPDAMFVNLFKGRNRVELADLESQMAGEVQMLLAGIVHQYPTVDLFTKLEIRNRIEQDLRETIARTLTRLGLELVQLRFIRFFGEAYEKIRREKAELRLAEEEAELTIARTRLGQRLRENLTEDKMHAFKTEKDFEDFVRQTEHELGIKQVIREDEMERLKERFRFERDREGLLRRIEIETISDKARRDRAWEELISEERQRDEGHTRQLRRELETAKTDAEKRKIQLELERLENIEDIRQAEEALRLREEVEELDHKRALDAQEVEARTLEARGKATAAALLSIVDGPAADRIARLEELRAQQNMTPEQILAVLSAASPDAAAALAKKYEAEGQVAVGEARILKEHLAEIRSIYQNEANRTERVARVAMHEMGGVAVTRAQAPHHAAQTVVTGGGGMGPPVVINVPCCRHCNAQLEGDGAFCSQCGKPQK